MRLPKDIWQLKGNTTGPNVTILGGTHGDELAGIEIIKKFLIEFQLSDKPSGIYKAPNINGNLFLGFGNPEAIKKQARSASDIRDLNRSFIKTEIIKHDHDADTPDLKRARELAPILENTDYLFDIHATSNPAPQFVCLNTYESAYKKYLELLPVEKILIDPKQIITQEFNLSEPGTTDYYVFKYGGSQWSVKKYGHKKSLALCYETGYQSDLSQLEKIYFSIIRLIYATKVIDKNELVKNAYLNFKPYKQPIYQLTTCIKARYNGFTYAKNMDRGWQEVKNGQILGKYNNGQYETIKQNGILLFPLNASKIKTGKSLYWLADEVKTAQP